MVLALPMPDEEHVFNIEGVHRLRHLTRHVVTGIVPPVAFMSCTPHGAVVATRTRIVDVLVLDIWILEVVNDGRCKLGTLDGPGAKHHAIEIVRP